MSTETLPHRAGSRARRACSSVAPGEPRSWAMLQVAERFGSTRRSSRSSPTPGAVPLEVLRRQLAARVRLPRAEGAPAPTIEEVLRFKRAEEPGAAAHHAAGAPSRRGDRPDDALRHLADPSRPPRGADSLADVIGSIQERGLLDRMPPQPGRRSPRTSPRRWSPRSGGRDRDDARTRSSPISQRATLAVVVAQAGQPVGGPHARRSDRVPGPHARPQNGARRRSRP